MLLLSTSELEITLPAHATVQEMIEGTLKGLETSCLERIYEPATVVPHEEWTFIFEDHSQIVIAHECDIKLWHLSLIDHAGKHVAQLSSMPGTSGRLSYSRPNTYHIWQGA